MHCKLQHAHFPCIPQEPWKLQLDLGALLDGSYMCKLIKVHIYASSPLWLTHVLMLLLSKPLHEDNHLQVTEASSSNTTTSSPLTPLTEMLSAWLSRTLFSKSQKAIQDNTDKLGSLQESYSDLKGWQAYTVRATIKRQTEVYVVIHSVSKNKIETKEVHHSVCVSD